METKIQEATKLNMWMLDIKKKLAIATIEESGKQIFQHPVAVFIILWQFWR